MLNKKYVGKVKRLNDIAVVTANSPIIGMMIQHSTTLNVMEYTAINNTIKRLKSC